MFEVKSLSKMIKRISTYLIVPILCTILFSFSVNADSEEKKYLEGWIYEGKTLHPHCFKTNWQSGTEIISLDDCLSFANKSFGFVKGSVLADGDNGKGVDWYSVSKKISTKKCQRFASKNVSYIKGKCIESYSVSAGQYGYGTARLSIFAVYGIFEMENGDKKIVPVKRY